MKGFKRVIGCLTLVLCLTLGLVACGGTSYKGVYVGNIDVGGGTTIEITIELKSDGKMVQKMGTEEHEGTYKIDGEKITFTMNGKDTEATIIDNVITVDGMKLTKK